MNLKVTFEFPIAITSKRRSNVVGWYGQHMAVAF